MKNLKLKGTSFMTIMLMAMMLFSGCKKEEITVSDIKISSDAETVKVGSTVTLSYTCEPAEAKVESAVWSSSAESVATVDQNGVVTGVAAGIATITITVNGLFTKTCAVTVENLALLPGEFSVSATKKVQFTRGNLYWDGSAWQLESSQAGWPTTWSTSHVGDFYWSKTASVAYAETYSDEGRAAADNFFCDETHSLTVDGQSGLYTLSSDEWVYLLNTNGEEAGARTDVNRFAKAHVDGVNGLIIFPDGYTTVPSAEGITTVNSTEDSFPESSMAQETWSALESAGCVFLPAVGMRNGSTLDFFDKCCFYWSATADVENMDRAYYIDINNYDISADCHGYRKDGFSVRLVCSVSK